MRKKKKNPFITKTALRNRGWTQSIIDKFIPKPHREVPNRRFKNAATIKLYSIRVVKRIEKTEEFKVELEKSKVRKIGSEKAVRTKVVGLTKYINEIVNVELPVIPHNELLELACTEYNEWKNSTGSSGFADPSMEAEFLDRLCVNYIRHQMTDYHYYLSKLEGRVGRNEVYHVIRGKIFEIISEKYPYLKDECQKQYDFKN